MNVYEKYGVQTILNVDGPLTRYGGAIMSEKTLKAMDDAAEFSVNLDELQAAASKVIARITHAEAGIVTSGTCAALTLATAACICGYDLSRMENLPDVTGIPCEVIMPMPQISGYDHAIRAAGAKLIGVGIPHATSAPFVVHRVNKWHIEAMISEMTVAIAYAVMTGSHPPLEEVIEIGKKYNIPVIVDAAPDVPPIHTLYRFIDMGADLVCVSGGKGIRGPQNSGILYGRKDLIASAAVQMLEAPSEAYDAWKPAATLIPKEKFRGTPTQGIGRSMKVSKETIIGLLTALEELTEEKFGEVEQEYIRQLEKIKQTVDKVPGVTSALVDKQYCLCGYPTLDITIDREVLGMSAEDVCKKLKDKNIYARDRYVEQSIVRIYSMNLNERETQRLCDELVSIFKMNG